MTDSPTSGVRSFRKKPVVIEAWQFVETGILPDYVRFAWITNPTDEPSYMTIPTPEGAMRANLGDWIIKGVKGEVYPCNPDIFEATYEPVE
jgi:hypothetical protein